MLLSLNLSKKKYCFFITLICNFLLFAKNVPEWYEHREVIYPEVGDIVKIYNAGGYGYCMASSYTGRLKPAEVMIDQDTKTEKLIRKRETFEDIVSKFIDF